MYDSLQFPVEMNTRGSKTLTTFIPFHTKYDLQEQFWLFSQLLAEWYVMTSKQF